MKCTPMDSGHVRCLSTVIQLGEVTRREFIDTAAAGLIDLSSALECLFLTSDEMAPLLCLSLLKQGEYKAVFRLGLTRFTVAV